MAFAPGRARNQHSSLQLILFLAAVILLTTAAAGETCTTQSALTPAQRASIAAAAHSLTAMVQADNTTLLRSSTTPEISKDFTALQSLVASTAPRLAGGVPTVDQIYLLDATSLKPNADGTAPDAQFYCSLNRSTMEVEFTIPSLPPGIYAFAMVDVAPPPGAATPSPYRLSYLLRQDPAQRWLLAGFYPRAATAAGHDGLWYWTHARQLATNKQPWNAWLYYQAAIKLLDPAPFVNSTHLDKLRTEAAAAAPPALSEGISVDAPLTTPWACQASISKPTFRSNPTLTLLPRANATTMPPAPCLQPTPSCAGRSTVSGSMPKHPTATPLPPNSPWPTLNSDHFAIAIILQFDSPSKKSAISRPHSLPGAWHTYSSQAMPAWSRDSMECLSGPRR